MPDRPEKERPMLGSAPAPEPTVSPEQVASDAIRDILKGINETQPMQIAHCKITLTTTVKVIDKKRFGDSEAHDTVLNIELELEAKT